MIQKLTAQTEPFKSKRTEFYNLEVTNVFDVGLGTSVYQWGFCRS